MTNDDEVCQNGSFLNLQMLGQDTCCLLRVVNELLQTLTGEQINHTVCDYKQKLIRYYFLTIKSLWIICALHPIYALKYRPSVFCNQKSLLQYFFRLKRETMNRIGTSADGLCLAMDDIIELFSVCSIRIFRVKWWRTAATLLTRLYYSLFWELRLWFQHSQLFFARIVLWDRVSLQKNWIHKTFQHLGWIIHNICTKK